MKKGKIYLESSVISYYTGEVTRDIIITARQQLTRLWWKKILSRYDAYISAFVLDEISKGKKSFVSKRLMAVEKMRLISTDPDMLELAEEYFTDLSIPEKSRYDCLHLSCCVISGMEIMVSWNFKHIANATTRKIIREINNKHGFITPEITTPEEMLGGE